MSYTTLSIVETDSTVRVQLNRPEKRNAISPEMIQELRDCFVQLSNREGIRAIVLEGKGKLFCAGMDINWMAGSLSLSKEEGYRDAEDMLDMYMTIARCPYPVLGKIHGAVFGGGMGLLGACDIVIAEKNTRFCFSEVRLGIIPAIISLVVLPKTHPGHIRRYYMTGEVFGPETARELGLVHEICSSEEELEASVQSFIKMFYEVSPQGVQEAKFFLRSFPEWELDKARVHAKETFVRLRTSDEAQEGFRAFLEKRKPAYSIPNTESS